MSKGAQALTWVTLAAALTSCFKNVSDNPTPDAACTPDCPADAGIDSPIDGVPSDAPPLMDEGASTLAGAADPGMVEGSREIARFDNPVTVLRGPDDTIYVADFNNHRVRAVAPDGTVSTASAATGFERPFGLAIAGRTLYVQTDNNELGEHSINTGTVWQTDLDSGSTTVIVSDIGRPRGMARLPDGRLVLADNEHHVLRVLDPRTGFAATLAGAVDQPGYLDASGSAARFNRPYGVAVLPDGRIAVADYGNHVIRVVTLAGSVDTLSGEGIAGWRDGSAATARFDQPQDVAADQDGNLFVADSANYRVRKVAPDGTVTTVAGDGVAGYLDHTDPLQAQLFGLEGLDVSADGRTIWVADGNRGEDGPHHRVRRINLP